MYIQYLVLSLCYWFNTFFNWINLCIFSIISCTLETMCLLPCNDIGGLLDSLVKIIKNGTVFCPSNKWPSLLGREGGGEVLPISSDDHPG